MFRVGKLFRRKSQKSKDGAGSTEPVLPTKQKATKSDQRVFLSHRQVNGGDQTASIACRLQRLGCNVWFDQFVDEVTAETMMDGVRHCDRFVLFLTEGLEKSWFTALEVSTAVKAAKSIVCVVETEKEMGAPQSAHVVLTQLFELISADPRLTLGLLNSVDDFLAIMGLDRVVPYVRHNFREERLELTFLSAILGRPLEQLRFTKSNVPNDRRIYVACRHFNGFDQSYLIASQFEDKFGTTTDLIESGKNLPLDAYLEYLIVFVSDGAIAETHVQSAILRSKRLVLVYEADHRREGAARCRDIYHGNEIDWLRGELGNLPQQQNASLLQFHLKRALRFSKVERKSLYMTDFLDSLADLLGVVKAPFSNLVEIPIPLRAQFANDAELKAKSRLAQWFDYPRLTHSQQTNGLVVLNVTGAEYCARFRSLFQSRILGFHDLTMDSDACRSILSLAAQAFESLPGFRRAFPGEDADAVRFVRTAAAGSLDTLAQTVLVEPCFRSIRYSDDPKQVFVLYGLPSLQLGRTIAKLAECLPIQYNIVLLIPTVGDMDPELIRIFHDFATIDLNRLDESNFPSLEKSKPVPVSVASSVPHDVFDVFISFCLEESTDAARSLSLDLVRLGLRVWLDIPPSFSPYGIIASKTFISIVTRGSKIDSVAAQHVAQVLELHKPMVNVVEVDPLYCGTDPTSEHDIILRRSGEPRRLMISTICQRLGLTTIQRMPFASLGGRGLVAIAGNVVDCYDRLQEHRSALALCRGISSFVLDSEDRLIDLDDSIGVFFLLTTSVLDLPLVQHAVNQATRMPCVFAYDTDRRNREAPVNHETGNLDLYALQKGLENTDQSLFKSIVAKELLQQDPKARVQGNAQTYYIDKIIRTFGSAMSDLKRIVPTNFDFLSNASGKCREMEPGTREWLFQRLEEHMQSARERDAGALLLIGGPGLGKSVVMAEIARRGNLHLALSLSGPAMIGDVNAEVAAFHFFHSGDPVSCSAVMALKSLAMQLRSFVSSMVLPSEEMLESMENSKATILDWVECLILEPARHANPPQTSYTLLLDALDECNESQELAFVLHSQWNQRRPKWLFLLVSTRPDNRILGEWQQFPQYILEASSIDNEGDLRNYLTRRLLGWGACVDPVDDVVSAILKQAEGLFIWIRFQEASLALLATSSTGVTVSAIGSFPKGMRQVYASYFSDLRQSLQSEERYAKCIFLALIAPRVPIPEEIWRLAIGYDGKDTAAYEREVLHPVSRLLLFESAAGTNQRVLKPPHKSMLDWLISDETELSSARGMGRSDLALDMHRPEYHRALSQVLLAIHKSAPIDPWVMHPSSSIVSRFVGNHTFFHLLAANFVREASEWLLDFDKFYRFVSQSVHDEAFVRAISDVEELLRRLLTTDISLVPFARFALGVLRLSQKALENDPRQLAGQVLGRVGVPPFDSVTQHFVKEAQAWIKRGRETGSLKVAAPIFGFSGLQSYNSAIITVLHQVQEVTALSLFKDGSRRICIGFQNGSIRVVDSENGHVIQSFVAHQGGINAVALLSQDARVVTASWDTSRPCVWDLNTCRCIVELHGHTMPVNSLLVSDDQRFIYTGSLDTTVRKWDSQTGTMLQSFVGNTDWVDAMSLTLDGCFLFSASRDNTVIRVQDTDTAVCVQTLVGHLEAINATLNVGNRLWSASRDLTIRIWDFHTAECLTVIDAGALAISHLIRLSDDSVFAASRMGRFGRIWDCATLQCVHFLEGFSECEGFAISQNERCIYTHSKRDRSVREWNIQAMIEKQSKASAVKTLLEHSQRVQSVALAHDGKWVATGTFSGELGLWDVAERKLITTLKAHDMGISCLAFSPDTGLLVSGSFQQSCYWKLPLTSDSKPIILEHSYQVISIRFSKGGKKLWIVESVDTGQGNKQLLDSVWSAPIPEQINFTTIDPNDFIVPIYADRDGSSVVVENEKEAVSYNQDHVPPGQMLNIQNNFVFGRREKGFELWSFI